MQKAAFMNGLDNMVIKEVPNPQEKAVQMSLQRLRALLQKAKS